MLQIVIKRSWMLKLVFIGSQKAKKTLKSVFDGNDGGPSPTRTGDLTIMSRML